MVQAVLQRVSFDEFIEWYPEQSEHRYELHEGVILEMPKPRGKHSEIAGFLGGEFGLAIRNANAPYFIPRECIVKSVDEESGYEPDVVVLDRQSVKQEPRWERESVLTLGTSVRWVVEVVSTNWQADYLTKLRDYEALGIAEYWIVDYQGLGGRLHIGHPKQPTVSIYTLIEGEYDVQRFRVGDRLTSPLFPTLDLSVDALFQPDSSEQLAAD